MSAPHVTPNLALAPPAARTHALRVLSMMGVLGVASLTIALATGSVDIDAATLLRALAGETSDGHMAIVGGLLAVAGALMQVLLRNPLADPYVLGISGGAAVGALTALLTGAAVLVMPAAFAGAFASTLIVFGLARVGSDHLPWSSMRLLLTGVVIAAGWGAVIALLLTLAPDAQLRGMLFWLLGDLSAAPSPGPALATLVVVLALSLAFARDMNVLSRGLDAATALGVAVPRATLLLHATAALAAAAAVTTAGTVGFVGLIVPHALRLLIGNDQRILVPASALAGGSLLVLADTLARSVVAPAQLPVGVVTALIGVPAFLYLLARSGVRE